MSGRKKRMSRKEWRGATPALTIPLTHIIAIIISDLPKIYFFLSRQRRDHAWVYKATELFSQMFFHAITILTAPTQEICCLSLFDKQPYLY